MANNYFNGGIINRVATNLFIEKKRVILNNKATTIPLLSVRASRRA